MLDGVSAARGKGKGSDAMRKGEGVKVDEQDGGSDNVSSEVSREITWKRVKPSQRVLEEGKTQVGDDLQK